MQITGKITAKTSDGLIIKYIRNSACFHCKSKDSCLDSEKKEEEISVRTDKVSDFSVNDMVTVIQELKISSFTLILIMYGIPVLLMIISAITGKFILYLDEGKLAAVIFLSLIPSFIICRFIDKFIKDRKLINYIVKKEA